MRASVLSPIRSRHKAPGPAAARLAPDDADALRRANALAHRNLVAIMDGEGGKAPLRNALALTQQLDELRRRLVPDATEHVRQALPTRRARP